MRNAPPVRIVIAESVPWRICVSMLGALTASVLVAWVTLHADGSDRWALALACLAGGAWSVVAWLRPPGAERLLVWDGGGWSLDGQPGDVRLMVDAGGWILCRFAAPATIHSDWLLLSDAAEQLQGEIHALRVALYALGPASAPALGAGADRAV